MSLKFYFVRLAGGLLTAAALAAAPKATAQADFANEAQPVKFHLFRRATTASFILANDAVIHLGTNSAAYLTDLRVGEIARVSYAIENGQWVAHEVAVNWPHGSHAGKFPQNTSTNLLHAHGAIVGYNANTGSLTIRYHRGN
jgi:hypothetical protein